MPKRNEEFLKRLLATFREEAAEHFKTMSAGLVELEKNPAMARQAQITETLFREVHSLKGAARAAGMRDIEQVCQPLESVLAGLKGGHVALSQPLFDLLYQALDAMEGLLLPEAGAARRGAVEPLLRRLGSFLHGRGVQPAPQHPSAPPPEAPVEAAAMPSMSAPPFSGAVSDTIRVPVHKLDAVMRKTEELLSPRLASAQRTAELRDAAASLSAWKKARARMRPVLRMIERAVEGQAGGTSKLPPQALPRLLEHLESEQIFFKSLEDRLLRLGKSSAHDGRMLAGTSDSLLHDVREMQLLPFSSLLEIVPRLVRELARDQGKQVELVVRGEDIEVDRHILEEMKAPLIHLIRNCIDHGIEPPGVRQERGKPAHGTLAIAIAQKDSGKIELRVSDDGAGIDVPQVKAAAAKLGLAGGEEGADGQEALSLVFRSGLSTSRMITDVSGRGLGLAIVREKTERLGGTVALESHPGQGASFRMILPLTLATFRGVLVRAGDHQFIIPELGVERAVRVARQDVRTVENRPAIEIDGQAVALADLGDVLELPRRRPSRGEADAHTAEKIAVIVLGTDQRRVAFRVDGILGEQEVLVKPLGRQLERVRNVAGASVLGNGRVVVVLNAADLLASAVRPAAAAPVQAEPQEPEAKHAILVAEDSVTSRTLLKGILESAGYDVTTAVDGADAYATLKTGAFDLIVSDVEMPRMDGFDLTARVRADKHLGDLPVVLVTALESREHRERGIDVGANAYIVKSSFDQSNLLEVVRSLL